MCMTPAELKKWREDHGYSQVRLAQALEVHVMTVSRWERGFREIPSFLYLALESVTRKRVEAEKGKENGTRTLSTMSKRARFRFKEVEGGEIIIYPNEGSTPQDKVAYVITPYVSNFVKDSIRKEPEIVMGASRHAPPEGSLGWLLKERKITPQVLSYLIPILVDSGFCTCSQETGNAFIVKAQEERNG